MLTLMPLKALTKYKWRSNAGARGNLESRVEIKTSTMSSICFICHFCRRPLMPPLSTETKGLDLSQPPAALTFPSAQGKPGDTPEEGSASRTETDLEELQGGASGWTIPDDGKMSRDDPSHFTLLGKLASGRTLSSIQRTIAGLGDVLSGEELGHPLCEDCTDSLLGQLDTQLRIAGSDCQTYKRCLETKDGLGEDVRETLEQELKVMELEEARLVQELEEVEKNRDRAAVALEAAQAETETLEQQERQYYKDLGELQWQQQELQDELLSLEDRLLYAQTQLSRLKRTNAFKAAFEICCDGPLAIINGFRLGCVPTVPVSWREINAAWGQTALLLMALSNTVGLQFQRYQLIPRGDHSYLKSLTEDPVELPLFCTGEKSSLLNSKFDQAMVAFLDCMQQFNEAAKKGEPALYMPYRIHVEEGLMEDPGSGEFYSIRTHLNTEERWTKALKLMLTNFKWSLDWVSLRYTHK
ncbi:PREDICTED: beclin-2-like [Myotis davidii]|uniref:beclin-2-like n=1 Tax=Myotis davidii TaxID=225400 RepID=UPI000767C4C9|nr:PREDICTED: beclin-2-like [Myotis davidii]